MALMGEERDSTKVYVAKVLAYLNNMHVEICTDFFAHLNINKHSRKVMYIIHHCD